MRNELGWYYASAKVYSVREEVGAAPPSLYSTKLSKTYAAGPSYFGSRKDAEARLSAELLRGGAPVEAPINCRGPFDTEEAAVREQGEESPALVTVDGVDYTAVIVRHEEDGRDWVELRCNGLSVGDGWYEDGTICENEPAGFPEEVYRALGAALRSGGLG
jgi:hypothetical protein